MVHSLNTAGKLWRKRTAFREVGFYKKPFSGKGKKKRRKGTLKKKLGKKVLEA